MKIISLRQKTALQNWVLGLLWKYQDVSNTSQSFTFSFIRAALQRPDARLRNLLLPWNFTTVKYLLGVAPYSGSEIYFVYDQICKCKIVLSETPSHSIKKCQEKKFCRSRAWLWAPNHTVQGDTLYKYNFTNIYVL